MTTVFYDTNGNFIAMIAAVLYGRDKNCIYWRCIYKTWRIEHFDKKNYKNIRWIQLLCSQIYITPLYWKIHNTFFFIYLTLYYYVFFSYFQLGTNNMWQLCLKKSESHGCGCSCLHLLSQKWEHSSDLQEFATSKSSRNHLLLNSSWWDKAILNILQFCTLRHHFEVYQ